MNFFLNVILNSNCIFDLIELKTLQPLNETFHVHYSESAKIKELEDKITELESTLKSKDDTITSLKSEVERLNTEIKSRSGIYCTISTILADNIPSTCYTDRVMCFVQYSVDVL